MEKKGEKSKVEKKKEINFGKKRKKKNKKKERESWKKKRKKRKKHCGLLL